MSSAPEALAGKRVLITGASRGIGAAVASRCALLGATVVRIARSPMRSLPRALDVPADLANAELRLRAFQEVERLVGTPDIIVSNAGSFLLASLAESSDELLREQLAINVEAPFALARHFLPQMQQRGDGTHLLVGSVADHRAFPLNTAYSAAKFGLRGLHETLTEEFRNSGVRCVLVSPGPTDTKVWDPVDPDAREGFRRRADMLQADDVADAVLWAITRPAHVHVEWIRLGPS